MTIKVLYLLHRLTFGGTERMVANLFNYSTPKVESHICSFHEPNRDFLDEVDRSKGKIVTLHKKDGNDFSIPFRVASLSKQLDIDIIHSIGHHVFRR